MPPPGPGMRRRSLDLPLAEAGHPRRRRLARDCSEVCPFVDHPLDDEFNVDWHPAPDAARAVIPVSGSGPEDVTIAVITAHRGPSHDRAHPPRASASGVLPGGPRLRGARPLHPRSARPDPGAGRPAPGGVGELDAGGAGPPGRDRLLPSPDLRGRHQPGPVRPPRAGPRDPHSGPVRLGLCVPLHAGPSSGRSVRVRGRGLAGDRPGRSRVLGRARVLLRASRSARPSAPVR